MPELLRTGNINILTEAEVTRTFSSHWSMGLLTKHAQHHPECQKH